MLDRLQGLPFQTAARTQHFWEGSARVHLIGHTAGDAPHQTRKALMRSDSSQVSPCMAPVVSS
jgi:hypothetical protein